MLQLILKCNFIMYVAALSRIHSSGVATVTLNLANLNLQNRSTWNTVHPRDHLKSFPCHFVVWNRFEMKTVQSFSVSLNYEENHSMSLEFF